MFKSYSSSTGSHRHRPSSSSTRNTPAPPSGYRPRGYSRGYSIPITNPFRRRSREETKEEYNFPDEDDWMSDKGSSSKGPTSSKGHSNVRRSVRWKDGGSHVSIRQIYIFVVILVTILCFLGVCSMYTSSNAKTHVERMDWPTFLEWLMAGFLVIASLCTAYWTLISIPILSLDELKEELFGS